MEKSKWSKVMESDKDKVAEKGQQEKTAQARRSINQSDEKQS